MGVYIVFMILAQYTLRRGHDNLHISESMFLKMMLEEDPLLL